MLAVHIKTMVLTSSVEQSVFLWCNANVLRLNAPLVLVKIKRDGFATTCLEGELQLCNLLLKKV